MKAVKETNRKYYKYVAQYEQDVPINLADSNNSNYINNNNFNVQSVTWWGTDQTYTFEEAFYANKLVVTIAHNAQGSARWDAVLVSINDNSKTLVNANYGWGANTTNTYTVNLDDYIEIRNVRIYVHITRSHKTYCYGGINIGIKADEVIEGIVEATIDDYDFYKDTYKYSLPVGIEMDVYKAIKF